jgi:hypothetical protein
MVPAGYLSEVEPVAVRVVEQVVVGAEVWVWVGAEVVKVVEVRWSELPRPWR